MKKTGCRSNFGYFLREGIHNIFCHGLMSVASIGMSVACLLIMGSFTLLAVNAETNLKNLERENEILAYVDENLTEAEARAVGSKIAAISNVSDCTFVSREEALQSFVDEHQGNALFQNLPDDVLRHRFQIHITDIRYMEDTVEAVEAVPGVADVSAQLDLSKGFLTVRNIAGAVASVLVVVMLGVSVFIVSNTVRLATFARREEIAVMKMVGATDWFICGPFFFEGLILGVLSAVIAFFLQWVTYEALLRVIETSDTMRLLTVMPFADLSGWVLRIFLITGLLVGAFGSVTTIRKYLRV
ncbi:MAG TPA: permease-like cell division protein FtsX [Oscillospiraceae bacterium]|nr:permease-like cell division protein FtsX [Oscillospiraceae bacterium]